MPLIRIGISRAFTIAVCVGALSIAAIPPSGASPSAQSTALPDTVMNDGSAPSVAWSACRDGFQCAKVAVPLDHGRPGGPKISLSLIRLPAAAPSQRIGSLLLNPGGPGGSGVDFVRDVGKFMPLEIRGRFDIVGFDPRGIMRSTPLRCYDTFDQALAGLPPFAFPVSTAEEDTQQASDAKLAAACAAHGGPILSHMSTADAARDMDVLRGLLGDDKLNYLGLSYGSMLGQTYANLFPRKVRAMVIDGVLDPIAWTTGRGTQAKTLPFSTRLKSDVGAAATLNEFFRLCDDAGPDCAFSGESKARYAALAAQLLSGPIEVVDPGTGETFPFTYADLIASTLGSLYGASIWPDLAFFLADIEQQATPAVLGQRLDAIRTAVGARPAVQEQYPNFIEGGPGVFCSDSINPTSFAAWPKAADNAERRHGYFGRPWTWVSSVCQPWSNRSGRTGTSVRGLPAPPTRCWSSGTTSTPPPPTRVRSPPPGSCLTPGCCPTPDGATPHH